VRESGKSPHFDCALSNIPTSGKTGQTVRLCSGQEWGHPSGLWKWLFVTELVWRDWV